MAYIDKKSAIDALKAIRYGLWEIDIPSPTVPEYVEHHEQIKNMLEITGGWIKKLEEQPTADVVEVKHGTWTEKEVIYIKDTKDAIDAWQSCRCSVCGRYHTQPYMYFFAEPRFCSYCGAKMDGKETEDA